MTDEERNLLLATQRDIRRLQIDVEEMNNTMFFASLLNLCILRHLPAGDAIIADAIVNARLIAQHNPALTGQIQAILNHLDNAGQAVAEAQQATKPVGRRSRRRPKGAGTDLTQH
jgi:hypothetical protein